MKVRLKIAQGPDKDQFTGEFGAGSLPAAVSPAKKALRVLRSRLRPASRRKNRLPRNRPMLRKTKRNSRKKKSGSFIFAVLGDTQRFEPGNTNGGCKKR